VTPDYRLIPEATAHEAVADALDAYNWVRQSLSQALGMKIGPVISAGSSAGAYLALTSASMTSIKPDALVLIYGMLDPISERYTKPGTNIFGMPPIDSQPLLDQWNLLKEKGETTVHTGYPVPRDPANDFRMGLITALHCMALFPDFMTGVPGLGRDIAQNGTSVVPAEARQLYTIAFERGTGLPRTAIFHGKNDLAVPFSGSEAAADSLRKLGVVVHTEFPDDAPHSFDSMAGNVDLEDSDDTSTKTPAFDGLRGIVKFLDSVVAF
jgi:acetyl esterase/lipase